MEQEREGGERRMESGSRRRIRRGGEGERGVQRFGGLAELSSSPFLFCSLSKLYLARIAYVIVVILRR